MQEIDLQTLSCLDLTPIDKNNLSKPSETVGHLINELLSLERRVTEDGIYGLIPSNPSKLPRAKSIPKPRLSTRWEKFAKEKGIQKVKKKRVLWNEDRQDFLPTFGYKNQGRKDKDLSDWITEVKPDAGLCEYSNQKLTKDPSIDLVAQKKEEKKKRIGKNEMQQKRNQEEAQAAVKGVDHRTFKKLELRQTIKKAKVSTASMGKFDNLDDKVKLKSGKKKLGNIAKDSKAEREQSIKIAQDIEKNPAKVNIRKAIKQNQYTVRAKTVRK